MSPAALIPLQMLPGGDAAAPETTASVLSPEIERERGSVMSDLVVTGLYGLGLLVAAFLAIKLVRRVFFRSEHGDDISPMTLKQMYERDIISTEEYNRLRRTVATRLTEQLAEEQRRREEERRSKDPVAARLAREALAQDALERSLRGAPSPPPPPPPPPPPRR